VPDAIKVGPKYTVHDAETHKVQNMTVDDIIAQSSNVGTIKIAQRVGKDAIVKELRNFGFGRYTALGLQKEQTGTFAPADKWNASDIGSIPIGQSVTATPLQIWSAYNTIANRGTYVAPRLIQKWTSPTGKVTRPAQPASRRVVSPETAMKVTQALERVIEDGTGKEFNIPGYNIAAKTGTALEPLPGGGYRSATGPPHYDASFAGFFPATNPQLSIMVMIDNPPEPYNFGATAAGPVFDSLAKEAMRQYGIAGDVAEPGTPAKPAHAQPAAYPTTTTSTTTTLPGATTTVPGAVAAALTPSSTPTPAGSPVAAGTSPPDPATGRASG
jgi:cell division protein FtsI (penicillin-binding protein 3)